jgi:hypothetical protein
MEALKYMLDTEWKYFKDHEKELVQKYDGKAIVIVGQRVVGEYPNALVAYAEAKPVYGLWNFLIQRCSARNSAPPHACHCRITAR